MMGGVGSLHPSVGRANDGRVWNPCSSSSSLRSETGPPRGFMGASGNLEGPRWRARMFQPARRAAEPCARAALDGRKDGPKKDGIGFPLGATRKIRRRRLVVAKRGRAPITWTSAVGGFLFNSEGAMSD
jgi:hypothetical protein